MNAKIALILPYFGTLPSYFQLWLQSAGYNKEIDFFVVTDCDMSGLDIPPNVHLVYESFSKVRSRFAAVLDFNYVLHIPYKLCDYRPLYGLAFSDLVEGYDFWGHCDPDVIWGRFNGFLDDELLANHDRIYSNGHLCMYRNTNVVNRFSLQDVPGSSISFRDVYLSKYNAQFDEGSLAEMRVKFSGLRQYNSWDFADVSVKSRRFITIYKGQLGNAFVAFSWADGVLSGIGVDGDMSASREFLYLHLQKRIMKYVPFDGMDFMVLPDRFVPHHELSLDEIRESMRNDWRWTARRRARRLVGVFTNARDGSLLFKYKAAKDKLN